MGLPQERYFDEQGERTLLSPTSKQYQDAASLVTPETRAERPALPGWQDVMRAIDACRDRSARVTLPSKEDATTTLAGGLGDRAPLNWERAMSKCPGEPKQVAMLNAMMTDAHLGARLKAELAFISAVNNRAWYAAGHAMQRLKSLDVSTTEVAALLDNAARGDGSSCAHGLARKLTVDPHLITDDDIARVREHFSDAETAQIIHVIAMANFFDRFTESLGLPSEE